MVDAQGAELTGNGQQASMGQPLRRMARLLVRAMLVSSILTASLVFASVSLPTLLGLKTMVVSSGSMEPTIRVGDAVIIRPAPPASMRVGDVVTFNPLGGQGMTTHRVVAIKGIHGRTYYQTKGDANATPDPNLTPAEAVYGKVALTLPRVGYLIYLATTTWGKVLMIGVPLLIVMVQEVRGLLPVKKTPQLDQGRWNLDEADPYEAPGPS